MLPDLKGWKWDRERKPQPASFPINGKKELSSGQKCEKMEWAASRGSELPVLGSILASIP